MSKYIVKPNQHVTHGDQREARDQRAHLLPAVGTVAALPPPPTSTYEQGDEIELSDDEAAAMPHAVATPEEFAELASPKAFMAKGYAREEAEKMAADLKDASSKRAEKRKAKRDSSYAAFGMQPTTPGAEPDPRSAGKFPDDGNKKK